MSRQAAKAAKSAKSHWNRKGHTELKNALERIALAYTRKGAPERILPVCALLRGRHTRLPRRGETEMKCALSFAQAMFGPVSQRRKSFAKRIAC